MSGRNVNSAGGRRTLSIIGAILAATLAGLTLARPTPAADTASKSTVRTPDWSGVWVNHESISFDPRVPRAQPANPPYNPEYAAKYRERLAALARGDAVADPTADCVLPGTPRNMNMPYPFEILHTPGRVTILMESMHDVRRIFTDGRSHPNDLEPTYNGHSIGRWEGSILVVDTIGLRADTVFDQTGTFHSDQMHVVERFKEVAPGKLQVEISVDDPKAFIHPWKVTKTYTREPSEEIMEYVCEENNRNPSDATGKTTVILGAKSKPWTPNR